MRETLTHGVSMVTAYDPNDLESPRAARHLPGLRAGCTRRSGRLGRLAGDLGRSDRHTGEQINVVPRGGFGTVCASFVAIPERPTRYGCSPPGPPHEAGFRRSLAT